MRENLFTNNMKKKSNEELETIIEEKDKYTNEALQAVVWELENRGVLDKDEVIIEIEHQKTITEESNDTIEALKRKEQFPTLYSKNALQGFTIFFSTIFGTFLLMHNLKVMKKPKIRAQVFIFGIGYLILCALLLEVLPKVFFITFIFNVIGYVILVEYFWNKHLGKNLKFKKKGITKPLIISLLISALFALLIIFPLVS